MVANRLRTRGSVFILVMVVVMVGGFLAMRLLPSEEIQMRREREIALRSSLTQIRLAIALERIASTSAHYHTDWNDPKNLASYLLDLRSGNFLDSLRQDPTIPSHLWGTAPTRIFWLPTRNFAASGSFEVQSLTSTSWATGSNGILGYATDSWLGQFESELDEVPGQNRFGDEFRGSGRSLLLIQP